MIHAIGVSRTVKNIQLISGIWLSLPKNSFTAEEMYSFLAPKKKDEAVIQDVLTVLGKMLNTHLDALTYARYSESVYGLLKVFAEADIIVATRFHGTVLSLFSGIPTLGVCYYRKAVDLLEAAGQGDYYVNIDNFDPNELFSKFEQLVTCKHQEASKLEQVISDYRNQLAQQYDSVLV